MIASKAVRMYHLHVKLIVAFALVWSFLMPTIETVVTPVSSAIPAVSSGMHGCSAVNASGQNLEKPEESVTCPTHSVLFFPLGHVVSTLQLRLAFAIPLLMKSLLLRPIKFTSNYVVV
ncbi:hypothetical protein FE784_07560 [Paenibacillus hemerocallicola]|uniref:DUF2946 domain-containing protein n=1 Tax=Paenibacillus hemerocallicola TaxID=1172614 RepID=A0A5C4TD92_9BACL|nr:hypothetical protein [Paenibacillus hemerocallicola]TNJ67044.1 hypothetical protein FE784_07560 [Paenibacillus hemerocallicola]